MYVTHRIFNLLNTGIPDFNWMRREIHLIDGTVLVEEGLNLEDAESSVENTYQGGKENRLDPILNTLRSLRSKARRLGVWNSVLEDTERGIINASLLLAKLGRRIRIILEELTHKLKQKLREAVLGGFREMGVSAASSLVSFFSKSTNTAALLSDEGYLVYLGLKEKTLRFLRVQPL